MSFNISNFRENISKYGVSKPAYFQVTFFNIPSLVLYDDGFIRTENNSVSSDDMRLLTLRCDSAEIPGKQIATFDNKIYGPIEKRAYQTLFSDLTLTFLETREMQIRKMFERWTDTIFLTNKSGLGTSRNIIYQSYYNDYVCGTVHLQQFDEKGDEVMKVIYHNVFPTNLNQMSLSWAEDGFHKFAVTFSYEMYNIEKIASTLSTLPNAF